jgi:hypothetical protein
MTWTDYIPLIAATEIMVLVVPRLALAVARPVRRKR